MKRERSCLVALAVAGAMVLGLSETSSAINTDNEMWSYTQPAAELVMPYDVNEGRVSFLVVSNISGVQVSTHWRFWNDSCNEEVNYSICLTPNDTVVVDPRNMQAQGPDNEPLGPEISLDDVRGVVTVVAYETDEDCTPFNEFGVIADNTIVGAFTFADVDVGYSFGNDAFGLGTFDNAGGFVEVPEPDLGNDFSFSLQTFNPEAVETSVVVLTHLEESSIDDGIVIPAKGTLRFSTSFIDTTEIPTSLPDTTVSCTEFYEISGDLIPAATTVETSGLIRLQPVSGLTNGDDYLYGIVGQAVVAYGASASLKVEQVAGSASPAFIDGIDKGLF